MSGSEHPNPPAFPSPDERDADGCDIRVGSSSMTLRDWFAGQALNALRNDHGLAGEGLSQMAAKVAFMIADAMLAERSKS